MLRASEYVQRLRGVASDPEDYSRPREWNANVLTSSLRTRHLDGSVRRFSETREGETEDISHFYRLDRHGLCNTLRAGTGSERGAYTSARPIHPVFPRVISVREAARLHSFPDWFRFHRTKWHGFRAIGNSVPPLFGRAIARSIVRSLGIELHKPATRISLGDPALLGLSRLSAAQRFDVDERNIPNARRRAIEV